MPQDFNEKTLERLIMENLDKVPERGFPTLYKHTISQFSLPSGRIMDIFSFEIIEMNIFCKVFELKRDQLNMQNAFQLIGYATELFTNLFPHFNVVSIEKYLIGADYNSEIQTFLESFPEVNIFLYKYGLDGLFFKKIECVLSSDHPEIRSILTTPTITSAELLSKILNINEGI